MTNFELKTALLDIIRSKVDTDIIHVEMGTANSAQTFRLENSSGCILIGSGGTNRFNRKAIPNEQMAKKIEYQAGTQIIVSIGYQTINKNIEALDALEEIVFDALTNLFLPGLSYPIIPLSIRDTFSRKGTLWIVLAFEAISMKQIAIHTN